MDEATKTNCIKSLVEMSADTKEANRIIEEYISNKSYQERICWIEENFDVKIIDRIIDGNCDEETILHDDYMSLLSAIVNNKWR